MRRKEIHSTDHVIGRERDVDIPVDGDIAEIGPDSIETLEGPEAMNKAKALAFNEEKIKVMVHESTQQGDSAIVRSAVNGKQQFIIRGVVQEIRRKYVETLARARRTVYKQIIHVNESTGNVVQKMVPSTSLANPFSVIEDRNPAGAEWLRKILAK